MSYDVSKEIAQYLHIELIKGHYDSEDAQSNLVSKLKTILVYNLDRDRIEIELRNKLLIRVLDSHIQTQDRVQTETVLSNQLREYFGGKFNHRFDTILQSFHPDNQPQLNE